MSIDIDIATDEDYVKIAKGLRSKDITAPLHIDKGMRKTERRGVLMTDVEGIEVDIHFDNETKLRKYEDIVLERGKITKVETPMVSLEDILIRKLIRYNPDDRTDVQEILTSEKVDWEKFEEKLPHLK